MFDLAPDHSPSFQDAFIAQYQTNAKICSQYIKIASQQLYLQEAQRISQANELLQKLVPKQRVKDLSEWDVFTTRDSVILEDLSLASPSQNLSINLSNITTDRGRLLTRRSALGSRTSRDFEGSINDAIVEIDRVCSPACGNLVRKLLEDYRKLKARAVEAEKKEKTAKHMQRLVEDLQQKNIMAAQRLEELEFQVARLRGENNQLRMENRELNEVLFQKMNEINSEKKIRIFEEIASHRTSQDSQYHPIQIVAQVVQEKEAILAIREEALRQVQVKVEEVLFNGQSSCQNCCEMLRRLKQSIMAYKSYLMMEGEQFQAMFDAFRERLELSQ